jgi:membrane-associated phospholipid phosphatase
MTTELEVRTPSTVKLVLVLALACVGVSVSRPASAQVVTAPNVSMPKWQGAILLDAPLRMELRAGNASGRKTADDVSTVLLYSMIAAPYAASMANVVARGGSWRDAAGLALVDSEALGIAMGVTFLLKGVAARERPYATAADLSSYCVSHPSDPQCGSDRNASFFSGHSAVAFTSASLMCTQQLVFGPEGFDRAACTGAFAVAATTAALRMVADMHYATDVLAGAGVGMIAGGLIPYVLHFAPWAPFPVARKLHMPKDSTAPKGASIFNLHLTPWGGPGGGGAGIGAEF